ncbi:Zinc finger protein 292 [Merluccius polli]|uniref:Zinc finger protein 292 n=1 Tax=Merluccius polli TaxID=89951 RepID=A0AA47NPJ6_MERPO|nr:Zinc finger protein 292 [Merluccius polli]
MVVCALAEAEVLQVMCGMERREEGGVLLCLCRAALRRLLHTGNMHGLWQLVCVWGSLHRRQQTSRLELLEESRHLLQSATNVTAIFPFIRVLLDEGLRRLSELHRALTFPGGEHYWYQYCSLDPARISPTHRLSESEEVGGLCDVGLDEEGDLGEKKLDLGVV